VNTYNLEVKNSAAYISKQIISYIHAVGMIIGIICANLADVIFGGIMLGLMLQGIDVIFGPPIDGWIIGFIASFAFWFIQLLMWSMIFDDNTVSVADLVPLILAVFVAIADTNIDVSPLFMWIESSAIAETLKSITVFGNVTLYSATLTSVIAGMYVVNGCSELFNAWYLDKIDKNPMKKLSNPLKRKLNKLQQPTAQQQTAQQPLPMRYTPVSKK